MTQRICRFGTLAQVFCKSGTKKANKALFLVCFDLQPAMRTAIGASIIALTVY